MKKWVDDFVLGTMGFGDRPGKDDAAFIEHDQTAVEAADAEQFVRDDDDRGAQFAVERQQQFVDLGSGDGV